MDTQLRELDRAAGRAGLQVFWIWERRFKRLEESGGAWEPDTPWKRHAGPFMFRTEAEQLMRERSANSTWEHQCVLVEGNGSPVLPEEEEVEA